MSDIIKVQDVRLAFANLFEAKAMVGATGADANKKRYGCTLIIQPDHPAIPQIKARIEAAATEKWKGNAAGMLASIIEQGRCAYSKVPKRNKKGEVYAGFEGMYSIAANRSEKQGRPEVFDADKTPLGEKVGRPYNGCYVNGYIDIWADDRWGPRICATLVAVQFRRDGDAFGGGGARVSMDDLEDVSDFGGGEQSAGTPSMADLL